MASTNVPPIQWTPEGVVLPTDAQILTGVTADWNTAFGGNLNPQLSSPQGQLESSETAIVSDKNSDIAYIANQVDPQFAEGRFQDAIGRIYFMTRLSAASTVLSVVLGGQIGAYIPQGTLAVDGAQNVYQLGSSVTIGPSGTVTGAFYNLANGPISYSGSGSLQIYQVTPGLDTLTGVTQLALGRDVESSQAFELRRQNTVAANSQGTLDSIFAAVFQVSGVLDVFVLDNPSGATVNYGSTSYPLAPHSLYVSVVGGSAAAVASAIWTPKNDGSSYSAWPNPPSGPTVPGLGTVVTEVVYDTRYSTPQPAYNVSWITPASAPVYFALTFNDPNSALSSYLTAIKNAIIAQFNGESGTAPEGIGSLVAASAYYASVLSAIMGSGMTLASMFVGLSSSPTGYEAQIGIDQVPTITAGNITAGSI